MMVGPTEERKQHPTPNGGVESVVYYRDAMGNPAPKEVAVGAEIIELDAKGKELQRTYMRMRRPQ